MAQQKLMLLLSALTAVLPQPSNRPPEFVPRRQDYVHVTLDRNTAHRRLLVSEDNRTATLVREPQPYPEHPDRHDKNHQILGSLGLSGRCYFEVRWHNWVDIAMTYKRAPVERNIRSHWYPSYRDIEFQTSVFGDNSHSWSLRIYDGQFFVCDDNVQEPIGRISAGLVSFSAGQVDQVSAGFMSGIVGVYLDHEAGILSFYEILDGGEALHLHTFRKTFTQPLFPGFGVWIVYAQGSGNSVSLVTPRLSPETVHPGIRDVRAEEPL